MIVRLQKYFSVKNTIIIQMQLQTDRTCDQSNQSNIDGIDSLHKQIPMSNSQLHLIISNPEKFSQRIKDLNRRGYIQTNKEQYEQALVYLSEAEKNLQYAASCGANLDRTLITSTLKNLACVYQRLWELSTCFDYMQALIFNLSSYTECTSSLKLTQQIKIKGSEQQKKVNKFFNYTLQIALSYLQFSALSSQLGKHKQAKSYVEKSLNYLNNLINECLAYEKAMTGKNCMFLNNIRDSLRFKGDIDLKTMTKLCQEQMWKIKTNRYFFNFDSAIFEKIAMGDIMQIAVLSPEQASKNIQNQWFISQQGLTYIAIYISCCYFAFATEIRLELKNDSEGQEKEQYQLAKLYHLHSIRIAAGVVLIQSNFLIHIAKSMKNNFGIDVNEPIIIKEEEHASVIKNGSLEIQEDQKMSTNIKNFNDDEGHDNNDKDQLSSEIVQSCLFPHAKETKKKWEKVRMPTQASKSSKKQKIGPFSPRKFKDAKEGKDVKNGKQIKEIKDIKDRKDKKPSNTEHSKNKDGRDGKMSMNMNTQYYGEEKKGKQKNPTKLSVTKSPRNQRSNSKSVKKPGLKGLKSPKKV